MKERSWWAEDKLTVGLSFGKNSFFFSIYFFLWKLFSLLDAFYVYSFPNLEVSGLGGGEKIGAINFDRFFVSRPERIAWQASVGMGLASLIWCKRSFDVSSRKIICTFNVACSTSSCEYVLVDFGIFDELVNEKGDTRGNFAPSPNDFVNESMS